jgi:hypothetical protein
MLKMLDCFCGMGGWSIGFWRVGFECHGIDIVDVGYPYNLTVSDIKNYHPHIKPDVMTLSPPCTEFSTLTILSWKKGQRGPPEPEKGIELVKEGMRIIEEAKPKFWVLENVWGSMKHLVPLLGLPKVTAKPWVLWGNFPYVNFDKVKGDNKIYHTFEKGKGGNRIGLPEDFAFDPLRSWKRARIPVFLSQKIAVACHEALQEESK